MDITMENDELQQRSENEEVLRMKRKRPARTDNLLGVDIEEEENGSGVPAAKYREVEEASRSFLLEDFSDEVLLEIFKNLDSRGLLPLMNCCRRFHNLILDRRFWNNVDVSEEPLPLGVIESLLERTHNNTQSIKLRGPPPAQHVQSEILKCRKTLEDTLKNRCTQLQVLELQGIPLDFESIRIVDFPNTLKRLVLNNCNVSQPVSLKNIFFGIDTHLTKLEELGVENNDWFMPEFLMTFSKAPALRWLSLKGCNQLYEFVPYGSMASRFGFKQLEFLDMRFTPITDSDLQCFNAVVTLKEILLDCPESLRNLDDRETIPLSEVINSVNNANDCQPSTSKAPVSKDSNANANADDETPSTSSAASRGCGFGGGPSRSPQWNLTISLTVSNNNSSSNNINNNSNSSSNNNSNNNNINNGNSNIGNTSGNTNGAGPSAASTERNQQQLQQQPSQQQPSNSNTQASNASPPLATSPSSSSSLSTSSSSSSSSTSSSPSSPLWLPASSASSPSVLAAPPNVQHAPHHALDVDMLPHRNLPSRSRFLPRPEQVILVDLHNRDRSIVVHGSPRVLANGNPNNHFDQVLNHPLFWDIINPLAQGGLVRMERAVAGNDVAAGNEAGNNAAGRHRHSRCFFHNRRYNRQRYLISDRGICCFGRPDNPVNPGIIWIRLENRPSENSFQRLSVRNYKMVTDISLQHLVQCSPQLVYLDLSGTSVTQAGVQTFKKLKPECEIIAEHLSNPIQVAN